MTTEQYSIGYEEGYQAAWNEAMDAKPAHQEPVAWAETAMRLAADFSIESLRLGSYERKDKYENAGRASWQTIEIREKREAARERLRQHVYTSPPAQRKPLTKTKVGNYLRRHAHGEVGMYRNGFKDGVAFAEAAHNIKENT